MDEDNDKDINVLLSSPIYNMPMCTIENEAKYKSVDILAGKYILAENFDGTTEIIEINNM